MALLVIAVFRVVNDVLIEPSIAGTQTDLFLLITVIVFIWILRFKLYFKQLISIYCLVVVLTYGYFWQIYGGYQGPFGYIYFAFVPLFITLLSSQCRLLFATIFCGFIIAMTLRQEFSGIPVVIDQLQSSAYLELCYIVSSMIMGLILLFLKNNYAASREMLVKENEHLSSLNRKVKERQSVLTQQKSEIKIMKKQLEQLVQEQTSKLETKNRQLQQYAYENAHLVRKPISNILGLLNVMEMERHTEYFDPQTIRRVRENAENLDEITRRINSLLK